MIESKGDDTLSLSFFPILFFADEAWFLELRGASDIESRAVWILGALLC
jgi:hypothetical protein